MIKLDEFNRLFNPAATQDSCRTRSNPL